MVRASNEEPPERALVPLRESEARFRELADSAPVLLWDRARMPSAATSTAPDWSSGGARWRRSWATVGPRTAP